MILDIIVIAVILIVFKIGYKKGFVKSIQKLAALVLTVILMLILKNPAVNFLSQTPLALTISDKISQTVTLPQGGGVDTAEILNLPQFMSSEVNNQISEAGGMINDTVNTSLTSLFITIIAFIGLFVIIRILLAGVFLIINSVTELPLIKGVNKLIGGLLAVVNIMFILCLLLAAVSLFAPADSNLFEQINNTHLVKYFYNYNILLQLFMKV